MWGIFNKKGGGMEHFYAQQKFSGLAFFQQKGLCINFLLISILRSSWLGVEALTEFLVKT